MKLKIVGILICIILIGSTVQSLQNISENNNEKTVYYEDELDQIQSEQDWEFPVGVFVIEETSLYIQVAQSFIPTKELLTRVELLFEKNASAAYPLTCAIRDNLTRENIVEISLDPDEFIADNFSWVEFDFEDIWLELDKTYYIVCYTENVTDNFYYWAAINESESYQQGSAWVSIDGGNTWGNQSVSSDENPVEYNKAYHPFQKDDNTSDMCFKTYGIGGTQLDIDVVNIGFGISAIVTNIGDNAAQDITWSINSHCNGLFRNIDTESFGNYSELLPGNSFTVREEFFLGLGPIEITISAKAVNSPEESVTIDGFLFFIIVILQ